MPVLQFYFVLVATGYDVEHAEVRTLREVAVLDVVVSVQNKTYTAFLEEVDAVDFISFLVNVFILLDANRLEHRADEGNKCPGLVLQEPYFFVGLFVNKQ